MNVHQHNSRIKTSLVEHPVCHYIRCPKMGEYPSITQRKHHTDFNNLGNTKSDKADGKSLVIYMTHHNIN